MKAWLLLVAAIGSEVAATTALKASAGFSRFVPSVVVVVGYLASFGLLAIVLRDLPVGIVYAVWSAVGTVGVALLGIVLFGETMEPAKALGIALVVGGVALLYSSSTASAL
ncbi:MAG TPA: multidrug efflux SMR transporter [Candidatus Limnocylindrales bacterium]